eukprot:TRINITY_DN32553_c0_g1_i2.p1 TRINITY_DN32553_c0_g1~~TRINITY_DN32553_c0_g1_i2.p1  ORF type:complete len:223 (-),score=25.31 TRINITY_DN32553_c0_g1_i2:180-848(-)
MASGWVLNGDFTLFSDAGKAYILYHGSGCDQSKGLSCWPPSGVDGTMSVDLLTADFTSSTRHTSGVFDVRGSEAPAMFRRRDNYFLLTATGCGFCPEGSDARVFTSKAALGPYHDTGLDLNPCRGHSSHPGPINGSSACGLLKSSCMPACDNAAHEVTAQQAWVLRLPHHAGQEQWLWAGDFWVSSPDGFKDHDLQVWLPLRFDDQDLPLPLNNISSFTVEI